MSFNYTQPSTDTVTGLATVTWGRKWPVLGLWTNGGLPVRPQQPPAGRQGSCSSALEVPAGAARTDALGARTSKGGSRREWVPWRNTE